MENPNDKFMNLICSHGFPRNPVAQEDQLKDFFVHKVIAGCNEVCMVTNKGYLLVSTDSDGSVYLGGTLHAESFGLGRFRDAGYCSPEELQSFHADRSKANQLSSNRFSWDTYQKLKKEVENGTLRDPDEEGGQRSLF